MSRARRGKSNLTPRKVACPECGYVLYRLKSTGFYHCGRCRSRYSLVLVDKAQALINSMRLMVRNQPMPVVEVARRLGVHSVTIRKHVVKAGDLYIFDAAVRYGVPPDWLSERD